MQVRTFFHEVLLRVPQTTRRWQLSATGRGQTIRCTEMLERNHVFVWRDGRKFQVRYNEADVSFPIASIGEALQQVNWFVFGPGCQAMLPGSSGEFFRTMGEGPRCGQSWRNTEECISCHVRRRNIRTEHRCARIPRQQGLLLKRHRFLCQTKMQHRCSWESKLEQGRVRCTSTHTSPISVVVRSLRERQSSG